MPGTAELQSLVTLEAMSASTPVLLADAMALPHLVHDGENGYLFTPNDSDDLAAKMARVFTLPADELAAMGKTSREMVENHSIEAHAADLRGPLPRRQLRRPGRLGAGVAADRQRRLLLLECFLPGSVRPRRGPGRMSGRRGYSSAG